MSIRTIEKEVIMENIKLDDINVDEIDDAVEDTFSPNILDKYQKLNSSVEKLQFIIDNIRDRYLPFFDNDTEMTSLLDELDIMVDVNDDAFELTADIVDNFITLSHFVRDDDVHSEMKERVLVLLTYALELVGEV